MEALKRAFLTSPDPILRAAKSYGLEVDHYTPETAPWQQVPKEVVINLALILAVASFLYVTALFKTVSVSLL